MTSSDSAPLPHGRFPTTVPAERSAFVMPQPNLTQIPLETVGPTDNDPWRPTW